MQACLALLSMQNDTIQGSVANSAVLRALLTQHRASSRDPDELGLEHSRVSHHARTVLLYPTSTSRLDAS